MNYGTLLEAVMEAYAPDHIKAELREIRKRAQALREEQNKLKLDMEHFDMHLEREAKRI